MHKDKISKDQQTNTGETSLNKLKTVYDKRFLEIENTQTRLADYIHTNAKNITELLNDLDLHDIQIKKIAERVVPATTHESNRNIFSCRVCNKAFSTKRSLYTHKSRYHKKESKEQDFKCEQCNELFKNSTSLAIHEIRFHGHLL